MPLALTAFEWLEDAIGGEVWTYPAIVAAVAFDSLLPVAPGEAVMITAGVLAADGDLSPFLVIAAGMVGGLLGYFGGTAFENDLWKPIAAAGIVAVAIAAGAELLRRARLS